MSEIASLYKKFGFNEPPFNQTPDTNFLFKSSKHMAAFDHLRYALLVDGFTLLTGAPGIGKTLLCRQILRDAGKDVQTVYIYNTYFSMIDLLKLIYRDITGKQLNSESHSQCFNKINQLLLLLAAIDKKVVVLIDEAQGLTTDVLEGLRQLSNLETEKKKLLSLILIGQPELESRLTDHNLRQLEQRISVRYVLKSFKLSETREYVRHRMRLSTSSVINDTHYRFTTFAICLVHWYSRGIPRRINQICDRALLASFNTGKKKIGFSTLLQAAREIIGRKNSGNYQPARHWLFVKTATILTTLGLTLYLGLDLYQDKIDKKREALSLSFEGYRSEHDLNEKEIESFQQRPVLFPDLKGSNVFNKAHFVNHIIANRKSGQEFLPPYLLRVNQTKNEHNRRNFKEPAGKKRE